MATALAYPNDPRPEPPVLLPLRPPADREPPRNAVADSGEFSARDVINALKYHMVLFLTLGSVTAAACAAAGWNLFPARYTTNAMLRVASVPPTLLEGMQAGANRAEFGTYIATQAGLIKSHLINNRAFRKPQVLNLPMLQGLDDPIHFLSENITVEFSERSELLKITMAGEDPAQITKIVNGVVEAFITEVETYRQEKQINYDKLLRAKSEQEKQLEDQAKSFDAQFRNVGNNEAKLKSRQGRLMRMAQLLQSESLTRAELSKARELMALGQVQQKQADASGDVAPDVAAAIDGDATVQKKNADITRIENYISYYRRTSPTPESEHIREYERKLAKERGDLEEVKRIKRESVTKALAAKAGVDGQASVLKYERDVQRLMIEEKSIKEELKSFADLLAEDPAAGKPPEQALAEIKLLNAQKIVSDLEGKSRVAKAELEADDRVKLIEKANVPQNREMKKQIVFTGVGGLAGFGLIGGLITVGELRRKRIYSAKDPLFVKLPLIGRIPEHGFVAPAAGADPAADDDAGLAFREAIDRVKTLVLRQMHRGKMQTLLVTSPAADEGKSILAWNLAAGFARTDYRVLFVDANLHTPSIHEHLDIEMPAGLAETLRGEKLLADVVVQTPVPNLFCLAAGSVDDEARRALDKGAIKQLIERAKKDFDFVVFDTCALVEAVDPLYLAQRVDAAVMSLRTFRSQVSSVEQACRRLKLLGTPILGAVLTDPTLNGADV